MPMLLVAIMLGKEFVERLEKGREFLQPAGDGAGRQMQIVAAEFGEDAVERLKEFELVLQNHRPQRNAEVAFGDQFVGGRGRDDEGLSGTGAGAAIALAMIASAMGADLDFEDVAVGGAGNFLEGLAAAKAALLVGGQHAGFVFDGEMLVRSSARAFVARLLTAAP
jgi:hypothetical protein